MSNIPTCWVRPALRLTLSRSPLARECFQSLRFQSTRGNPEYRASPVHSYIGHPDGFALSNQVKKLCYQGQCEDATQLVMDKTPHGAQDLVPLWSQLVGFLFRQGKSRLALQVWQDVRSLSLFLSFSYQYTCVDGVPKQMKKRGIVPSQRFYVTAFAAVQRDQLSPNILQELQKHYQRYLDSPPAPVDEHSFDSFASAPVNAYLDLLQHAGYLDEALETFHQLPSQGPFAPDHRAYTSIWNGLAFSMRPWAAHSSPERDSKLSPQDKMKIAHTLWKSLTAQGPIDDTAANAYLWTLLRSPHAPADQLKLVQITASLNNLFLPPSISKETSGDSPSAKLNPNPDKIKCLPGLAPSLRIFDTVLHDVETPALWLSQLLSRPVEESRRVHVTDMAVVALSAERLNRPDLVRSTSSHSVCTSFSQSMVSDVQSDAQT